MNLKRRVIQIIKIIVFASVIISTIFAGIDNAIKSEQPAKCNSLVGETDCPHINSPMEDL